MGLDMNNYTDKKGNIKSADQWLDDMGGIEAVIDRPIFGAPTEELIHDIMIENGLTLI